MTFKQTFEPIPSLDGKYEIDTSGVVRNAKTKKPLKLYHNRGRKYYVVSLNGTQKKRCVSNLLFEVHGIVPTKTPTSIGVTIRKNGEAYYFESLNKAAKFIAQKEHYELSSPQRRFANREPEVYGWKITYHEPEQRIFKTYHGDHKRRMNHESNRI